MAECNESISSDDLPRCLEIVFIDILKSDKQRLLRFFENLRERKVLTSDEVESLITSLQDEGCRNTIVALGKILAAEETKLQHFRRSFLDIADLDADEKAKSIANFVLQGDSNEYTKVELVFLWEQLLLHKEELQSIVDTTWTEYSSHLHSDWPYNIVHFCLNRDKQDMEKVENFVNSIAEMKPMFIKNSEDVVSGTSTSDITFKVMVTFLHNFRDCLGEPEVYLSFDGGNKHMLEKHELGYRHVTVACDLGDIRYNYCLQQGDNTIPEFIKGGNLCRFVTLSKGRRNAVMDVAVFGKDKLGLDFKHILTNTFESFLPDAETIDLVNAHYMRDCLIQAIGGWTFQSTRHISTNKVSTKHHIMKWEDIEDILYRRLLEIKEAFPSVKYSLYIIYGMHSLKRDIKKISLYEQICESFILTGENDQSAATVRELAFSISDRNVMMDAIYQFCLNAGNLKTPKFLLVIPIFILLEKEGVIPKREIAHCPNLLYNRAWLPRTEKTEIDDWDALRQKVQKKLVEMATPITKLASTHGYIIDTYNYFISLDGLVELVKKEDSIITMLQIDSVLSIILQHFSPNAANEKEIVKKCNSLLQYLENRFLDETYADSTECSAMTNNLKKNAFKLLERIKEALSTVVEGSWKCSSKFDCSEWLISMAIHSVRWYTAMETQDGDFDVNEQCNELLGLIQKCIANFQKKKKLFMYINKLLNMDWPDEKFQAVWGNGIIQKIEGITTVEDFFEKYLELQKTGIHTKLKEHAVQFTKVLVKSKLLSMNKDRQKKTLEYALRLFSGTVMIVFCEELKEYEDKNRSSYENSLYLITHSNLTQCFYVNIEPNRYEDLLSNSTQMKQVNVHARSLLTKLLKKSITKGETDIIMLNKQRVSDILSVVNNQMDSTFTNRSSNESSVSIWLDEIEKIIESYQANIKALKIFLRICDKLAKACDMSVSYKDLKDLVDRDISKCKVSDLEQFDIDKSYMDSMLMMLELEKSAVFEYEIQRAVLKYQEEHKGRIGDWKNIFHQIWEETAKASLEKFICDLKKDCMHPEYITTAFCLTEGDEDKIKGELSCLFRFHNNFDVSKCEKVEVYNVAACIFDIFVLHDNLESLKWISGFCDEACIKKFLANYCTEENKIPEHLCTAEIVKLREAIREISKDIGLFQSFSKQNKLIERLQSKKKELLDEICHVAILSSVHNKEHNDRWQCLKDAVNGFCALIYDVKTITSIEILLDRCKIVSGKVKRNRTIVKAWARAAEEIDWYDKQIPMLGSMKLVEIEFAEQVNRNGVYIIEKPHNPNNSTLDDCVMLKINEQEKTTTKTEKPPTPTGAMSLNTTKIDMTTKMTKKPPMFTTQPTKPSTTRVTPPVATGTAKTTDEPVTRVTPPHTTEKCLQELKDAASFLALYTYEEKGQEKEQYSAMLAAMEGLAEALLYLCNAGFTLFNEFKLRARSKRLEKNRVMSDAYITVTIEFRKNLEPFEVNASINMMNELTAYLRNALQRWQEYVSKMRLQHYHLNEYSTQQINYLCESLGKIHLKPLEDQVYLLLSDQPRELVHKKVCESLKTLRDEDDLNVNSESEEERTENVTAEETLAQKKQGMVQMLMHKRNVDDSCAKAAVQARGHENYNQCVNWILQNRNSDKIMQLKEEFEREIACIHNDAAIDDFTLEWKSKTVAEMITQLQSDASAFNLMGLMKKMVSGYLRIVSGTSMDDCLQINQLGRFLTILKKQLDVCEISEATHMNDSFINKGRPNFLLVGERQMIPLVVSLYMTTRQRLPRSNEVLLCSESTTKDEVQRFIHRAMCKSPTDANGIFCIASIEKLNLDVSREFEAEFDRFTCLEKYLNDEYRLVLLSSSQHHLLSKQFSKYKHEDIPDVNMSNIKTFIKEVMDMENLRGNLLQENPPEYLPQARVVRSLASGLGKSLYIKRMSEKPSGREYETRTIRLLEEHIDKESFIRKLISEEPKLYTERPMLIHIDITPVVGLEINKFIFDLLMLGMISDGTGKVWRRLKKHCYALEVTIPGNHVPEQMDVINILPSVECISPTEVYNQFESESHRQDVVLMDKQECESARLQRTAHYLKMYESKEDMSKFNYTEMEKKVKEGKKTGIDIPVMKENEVLRLIMKYCGIDNPTWAQLKYFTCFLNIQLLNCEKSDFLVDKHGFHRELKKLTVNFMIRMAKDFMTPSFGISDESPADLQIGRVQEENPLEGHNLRKRWETEDHPFIFFNDDGHTMTFFNVNISDDGNLLDRFGKLLEKRIITRGMVNFLKRQGFQLKSNSVSASRKERLGVLANVLGVRKAFDPDESFTLTTDNALKIIAIYLRLRCGIPVIIMGDTGCGKTRMIDFLFRFQSKNPISSEKKSPVRAAQTKENSLACMTTVKVHGGTAISDIFTSVRKALEGNSQRKIIFFDESNTTQASYAIKEVVCDGTIDGKPYTSVDNDGESVPTLQIVAACNPYQKLPNEAIKKLEKSGLSYRVKKQDVKDKFGNIPMRSLVYRVVPLPPSMRPLLWDFGRLPVETEKEYISHMVANIAKKYDITDKAEIDVIVSVVMQVQIYIRSQPCEFRYVSLRDIKRTEILFGWFHNHRNLLFTAMDEELQKTNLSHPKMSLSLRCLIHAVRVCYYVSLDNRQGLLTELSRVLKKSGIVISQTEILREFDVCLRVFHSGLIKRSNTVWNQALSENVFLMAVCADTQLPLFIVGKPGTSKSLAKSIIDINMKGPVSSSKIFRKLKEVDLVPFQCSAQTKAKEIEDAFHNAALRQKVLMEGQKIENGPHEALPIEDEFGTSASEHEPMMKSSKRKNLSNYTSWLVFEEIGLAEDSSHMPLKMLHSLLEGIHESSDTNTAEYNDWKKVAFVGLSNWALDPAKMNRGVFVIRNDLDEETLMKTAEGFFCSNSDKVLNSCRGHIKGLINVFMHIYDRQSDHYFGLRDFYSIISLLHSKAEKGQEIEKSDLVNILKRNFSGGNDEHSKILRKAIREHIDSETDLQNELMDSDLKSVFKDGSDVGAGSFQGRPILLLTKHHASLHLLTHILPEYEKTAYVMFGSSFPCENKFQQLCKNIGRIRICMEEGKRVICLNMTDIHEALYEMLNQHYLDIGDEKYVAIGIGKHRVFTVVHKNFRFIIVEKCEIAHAYPIPLISRLEKHHLSSKRLMSQEQAKKHDELCEWVKAYSDVEGFNRLNCFPGFNEESMSSVVLAHDKKSTEDLKHVMLKMATVDSLFRLENSKLGCDDTEKAKHVYMEQHHDCLYDMLHTIEDTSENPHIVEVLSFSKVLSESQRKHLQNKLNLPENSIMLITLNQFKTENEYGSEITQFFKYCCGQDTENKKKMAVLLIQTHHAHRNGQLIESAKHFFMMKKRKQSFHSLPVKKVVVIFILATERYYGELNVLSELIIQPTKDYDAVYIDELGHTTSNSETTFAREIYGKGLPEIFQKGKDCLTNEENFVLSLLQGNIVDATSKLYLHEKSRQMECINILLKLCCNSDSRSDNSVSHRFLRVVFDKMRDMTKPVHGDKYTKQWITEACCSRGKLHEGGTFGKTVCLCLKRHMSFMLSEIVNILHVDGNMTMLLDNQSDKDWRIGLWLKLFSAIDFMPVDKSAPDTNENHQMKSNSTGNCCFPFTFIIKSAFHKIYDSCNENDRLGFFCNQIERSDNKYIKVLQAEWVQLDKPGKTFMMQRFAEDLMEFHFKHSIDQRTLPLISTTLFEFASQTLNDSTNHQELAVVFYHYMELSDHLFHIAEALEVSPVLEKNTDSWLKKQKEAKDDSFHIHEYVLDSLLEESLKNLNEIEDEHSCMKWMEVTMKLRKVFHALFGKVKCGTNKQDLLERYKPIGLIDSLLRNMLPNDFENYSTMALDIVTGIVSELTEHKLHSFHILSLILYRLEDTLCEMRTILYHDRQRKCHCGKGLENSVKLPCGKFACMNCANEAFEKTHICPQCFTHLDETFKVSLFSPTREQQKRLYEFRTNITGFFLDYLNEYCFEASDDDRNTEEKISAIFQGCTYPTGNSQSGLSMSCINLNIASMSYIFTIILRNSPEFVKAKMSEIMNAGEALAMKNMLLIVLNMLPQHPPSQQSRSNSERAVSYLEKCWPHIRGAQNTPLTLSSLEDIVRVRFALTEFVKSVYDYCKKGCQDDIPTLILKVAHLCESSDTLWQFTMDEGIMHHGRRWLHYVEKIDKSRVFLNKAHHRNTTIPDLSTLFGPLQLQKLDDARQILLQGERKFMRSFSQIPLDIKHEFAGIDQLVLSAVRVILCKVPLGNELYDLVIDPTRLSDRYWPTMPELISEMLNDVMQDAAQYRCPNGHIYYIGECRRPWEMSYCPECHCLIGGAIHTAARGNKRLSHEESSMKGYQLHKKLAGVEDSTDRITPQAVAVIHFLYHSCMIMALSRSSSSLFIQRMIWKKEEQEAFQFLLRNLCNNLEEMALHVGCNLDDGILLMQQIFVNMLNNQTCEQEKECSWPTLKTDLEQNRNWEREFRRIYLQPVFCDAEQKILESKQTLYGPEHALSILDSQTENNEQLTCSDPILWTPIKKPSTEHLLHSISYSTSTGSVLKTVLETPNLHLLVYLPSMLKLQNKLIKRFQNKKDMMDVDKITFRRIKKDFADLETAELLDSFKQLWSQIYPTIYIKNKDANLPYYEDLGDDIPITVAIPCAHGNGRCAKLISEYLITVHNNFLDNCSAVESGEKREEIEVSRLLEIHFVCVDKSKDLLPLIEHLTSYDIFKTNHGLHHHITYSISVLEKRVQEKYVMNKKKILKKSLPCIKYADTGIGPDWKEVRDNIPQMPLSAQALEILDDFADRSTLTEICDCIRTIAQVIRFLAKEHRDLKQLAERKLKDYLSSDLMMASQDIPYSAIVSESILIGHTLNLFLKLTWYKAVKFVRGGLGPYRSIIQKGQSEIKDEALHQINEALSKMDVVSLQQHVNEMLTTMDLSILESQWSLNSVLNNIDYLQDGGDDSWEANLPEGVLFKHVACLFRLSVMAM